MFFKSKEASAEIINNSRGIFFKLFLGLILCLYYMVEKIRLELIDDRKWGEKDGHDMSQRTPTEDKVSASTLRPSGDPRSCFFL